MKYIITALCVVLSSLLIGQSIDTKDFENLKFRNIGPAGMSGRITAIDVDLSNTNRIFIGSASGGVWKSENGGISWEPIFDDVNVLSVGALKINQQNPAEIWVGTGEGNPRNSHNSGAGVYKTIDGGKTWNYMGLKETKLIHRIIINEHNPKEVVIGALGSAWGKSSHRGVYKTIDGGESWNKILYTNDETGVGDMVVDPKNPNKILVGMWEFGRKPWTFNSGGKGSGLHLSYDGGKTWKKLNKKDNGIPDGIIGRVGLAISPSKPNIIYALIESKDYGLYKSEDGGENWKLVSKKNVGNRPFYYAEIYVDPANENRIFNLWSYVSMSEDGGKNFKTIMDYGNNVHPDHHAFWISPTDPNYMINGNDGGLNISRDGGKNWRFVTNIPVGQFYHISVDNDFPYNVYGGLQDNGSWIGPGFVLKRGGIRNGDWSELYFGDGFDIQARRDDNRYGYAMSQGGNLSLYDRITGSTKFIRPTHPDNVVLRFNWNAALALDPFDDKGLYYGSQFVHYSSNAGDSWEIISPDLTTNDTTKQKQHLSGGLTIDDTDAENNTCILSIAPSPINEDVIWVGTDDGNLQLTLDKGANWTKLNSRIKSLPKAAFIPQIHPSKYDDKEAFIVANNYRMNDWSAHLYYTNDAGKSFKRIVDDTKVKGFVNAVVQDPVVPNLLFLGTDVGLYISFDKGANWTHWTENLPPVQIRDMVIQEEFGDLIIGTFGRAIWVLDELETFRDLAKNPELLKKDLAVFTSEAAYNTSKRSYDGIRFIGQAEFVGDNSYKGARFPIWLNPEASFEDIEGKEDDDAKEDNDKDRQTTEEMLDKNEDATHKLKLCIIDSSGDTIRNLTKELKTTYNVMSWRMDAKSEAYPSRREPKKDYESGGMPILPGKYKAIFSVGDVRDSSSIEVKMDPRSNLTYEDLVELQKSAKEFNANVKKASDAFKALGSARKSIGIVKEMIQFEEDSIQKEYKTKHKNLMTKIDSLENLYMLPKDTKGYQDSSKKLNSYLYRASRYISSSWGAPKENANNAVNKANMKIEEVLGAVNEFLTGEWQEYQENMDTNTIQIFEKKKE